MTLKINTRYTPSGCHSDRTVPGKFSLSLSLSLSLTSVLNTSITFELSHIVQLHQEHSPPDNPLPRTFLAT
jgi:hypothetical protein